MRRAVDGLLSVVTLETALPLLKVVTVPFLTTGFLAVGVATLRVAVGEVLRVLVLRGALGAVAVDLDAVDLRGINSLLRVYPIIIPIKKPLSGFL